jgi:hypothetical protein
VATNWKVGSGMVTASTIGPALARARGWARTGVRSAQKMRVGPSGMHVNKPRPSFVPTHIPVGTKRTPPRRSARGVCTHGRVDTSDLNWLDFPLW